MHAHDRPKDTAPERAQPVPRPARADGSTVEQLLALQRSVGNAAAADFLDLARQADEEAVQRSTVHDVLSGPGTRLDPAVKADAEARFGRVLPDVRVHTGAEAARSAEEVGAAAYTSGTDVVAGPGGMSREDMYHELWHVVQQQEGPVPGTDRGDGVRVSDPADHKEKEAEAVARKAVRGEPLPAAEPAGPATHSDGHSVQRSPRTWSRDDTVRDALEAQPGLSRTSRWPRIQEMIRRYLGLLTEQLDDRETVLGALENAIRAWNDNQASASTLTFNREARDRRRAILAALGPLIAAERDEIRQARQQPPPQQAPGPTPAMPMATQGGSRAIPIAMPGRGAASRPPVDFDDFDDDVDDTPRLDMARLRALNDVPALPPDVRLHLHLTGRRRLPRIHDEGLVRGAATGIGPPQDGGAYDENTVYTLTGSNPQTTTMVSQDVGDSRPVGVLGWDTTAFGRDVNYSSGAAQYDGDIPPVRDAPGVGPFSFTLPATPRTRQGIAAFLNSALPPGQRLNEDEALLRVRADLWRRFGLAVAEAVLQD